MTRCHLTLLAVAAALACAHQPVSTGGDVPALRLPRDVRPLHYALELAVDPERDGFQGTVAIDVELQRPTETVWLHARDLTIRDAWVEQAGRRIGATVEQVTPEGAARFTAAAPLPAGNAKLHVAFSGVWNERLTGLYRARVGGAGYVYSQFEPIDARRAFPGFDEPAFKTPFDVTLVVPEGDVAVSNAPVAREETAEPGTKRVRFATTEPLPTYLVFAAVGPFEVVTPPPIPPSEIRSRPLPLRAIVPRGSRSRFAFALQVTREQVPLLERWFGIPFPYPKLDQVVAPDFAASGMENAGAILYGEERLAFEPGRSPEAKRIAIGSLVAHELAHQWFGDLVTLAWWDDIWLNESFATFMAWKTVQAWRPDAGEVEEVAARVDDVMRDDALAGARAVRQPLQHMADVRSQFDLLSYVKGGAVLATLERFMGAERFRAAIDRYLEEHAYATGSTADLVVALSRFAGRDLGPVLRSYLDQPGPPLVDARTVCDAQGARIDVQVSRYRPIGSQAEAGGAFTIPVCARYEAAGELGDACVLVERGRGSIALPACPRWIMPAAGGTSYYRWLLPDADLARLRDHGFAHLAPAERVSYAQSLRAAARAGRMRYGDVLAALAPLIRDGARRVATAAMPALQEAFDDLVPDAARAAARAKAAELYRARLRELGLDPEPGEPLSRTLLRRDILRFLVQAARDGDVTRALARSGVAYAGGSDDRFRPEAVPPDLAATALDAAIVAGDATLFDTLERRLLASDVAEERVRILDALGSARDPVLVNRSLDLAGDPRLRVSERARTLFDAAAHPETRPAAWKTLRSRWDLLVTGLSPGAASRLPEVAAGLCDRTKIADVQRFLDRRVDAVPGARRRLTETVERIELCAALRDAQGASAAAWFSP